MKLLIKGMVCDRCIYVLSEEFLKLGFEVTDIRLGEVTLKESIKTAIDEKYIKNMLHNYGFELLYNKDQKMVEQIKGIVEKSIQLKIEKGETVKFSNFLSKELNKDYDSLSSLFSTLEGQTLEQYIISRKIEKVKEFLVYTELSLSDIAFTLGYSSAAYLSYQLKKQTGFTSSHFQKIKKNKRKVVSASAFKNNEVKAVPTT